MATAKSGDAFIRLKVLVGIGIWKRLCPEVTSNLKGFKSTINMATVTMAKEPGFVEADKDVEEVLASHDQELTHQELMQLQE